MTARVNPGEPGEASFKVIVASARVLRLLYSFLRGLSLFGSAVTVRFRPHGLGGVPGIGVVLPTRSPYTPYAKPAPNFF
jgi:hypothetical protein